MSKAEHILTSNTRSIRSRRRSGFLGARGIVALLALITLLLFVFFTQPQMRETVETWISLISG
ncbi:hypothetical protein [Ruegeria atlantica]|uniref:hypothetical protein n=1 Tax=Ruegeria atlantica TaxID=81569 RepID=UPI00147E9F4D|nr:hypothetical protein [Ruegeria atlantica]